MKRLLLGLIAMLALSGAVSAQQTVRICNGTQPNCPQVSPSNPLPVTTSAPSGTQDVNIKQVGGSATSAGVIGAIGPSASTAAGIVPSATSALASNKVLKSGAGNLYSFQVGADSTLSGAAWWIMVFDATSLPADGAVTPVKCYPISSGTTGASFSWSSSAPASFTTGIVIGVSTTGCFTLTNSVHAFISGEAK